MNEGIHIEIFSQRDGQHYIARVDASWDNMDDLSEIAVVRMTRTTWNGEHWEPIPGVANSITLGPTDG